MADSYYEDLSVGDIHDRGTIVNLGSYWRDSRYSTDGSGNVEYIGRHYIHNNPTTDTSWEIWKFTYSGGDLARIEGPLPGSWDGRAALSWGT